MEVDSHSASEDWHPALGSPGITLVMWLWRCGVSESCLMYGNSSTWHSLSSRGDAAPWELGCSLGERVHLSSTQCSADMNLSRRDQAKGDSRERRPRHHGSNALLREERRRFKYLRAEKGLNTDLPHPGSLP